MLRYTNGTLGTIQNFSVDGTVAIAIRNAEISIRSLASPILKIAIFDMVGRQVYFEEDIYASQWVISNFVKKEQTLIIKVTLTDGTVVSKKVIY